MNYQDYKISRNLAWEILLKEEVNTLPVSLLALCRQMEIAVGYYEPEDNSDGKSTIIDNHPVILVSSLCGRPRQRFTVAHELGHILLGHVGMYQLVNREPSPTDNPVEQVANVFAARLLAPACVLWGCGVRSAEDIMRLCDISRQSAEYRWARMQELYTRGKFLTHPLEQAVYRQFADYIRAHKL